MAGEEVPDVVEQRGRDQRRAGTGGRSQVRALQCMVDLADVLAVSLAAPCRVERDDLAEGTEPGQASPPSRMVATTAFNARIIVLRRRSCWHSRKP